MTRKDKQKDIAEERKQKAELRAKKLSEPGEVKGFMRAVPIVLIAAALFITLCFITAETGAFGSFISKFLKGLFSYMAYTIPFFIALHAIFFYGDVRSHKVVSRIIFSVTAIITLSEIAYIITNFSQDIVFNAALFYNDGIESRGGGFIGGLFGFVLTKIFGKFGLIIIIALSIALFVLYFLQGGGNGVSRYFLEKLGKLANFGAKLEKRSKEKKKERQEAKLKKQRDFDDKRHAEIYNDDFFHADNGISRLEIPELGILETKNGLGDSHILRETVIRSEECETEENPGLKSDTAEKTFNFDSSKFNPDPMFKRVDDPIEGFRSDDIVYEQTEDRFGEFNKSNDSIKESIRDFGIDDSAEAIFTADFDPFDIAMNEKRASKQSSKAAEISNEPRGFSEFISEMTPEQTEQMKRLERFEESRMEALRRKEAAEAREAEIRKAIEAENARIAREKAEEEKKRENEASSAHKASNAYGVSHMAEEIREEEKLITENRVSEQRSYNYNTVNNTSDFNSDYESQYGSASSRANADNRYRFVKEIVEDPRLEYNSSESTVSPKSTLEFTFEPTENIAEEVSLNTDYEADTPIRSFNYESDGKESSADFEAKEFDFDAEDSEEEISSIQVSRSMLDATLSISDTQTETRGLDFSAEENETAEDFSEDDAEEIFEKTEIPPEERNPKIEEYRNMFSVLKSESPKESLSDDEEDSEDTEYAQNDDISSDEDILFDEAESVNASMNDEEDEAFDDEPPFEMPKEAPRSKEEKPKPTRPDYSNYRFPPYDLLKQAVIEDYDSINDEMQLGAEQLINTLESFNIRATMKGMERGPRITRYSIVPAKGIRVNQIEKLSDDIALAMAAESIRIEAPIPGKSAVGVEVPNRVPSIVSLRELLESSEFINDKSKTVVCLGKSVEGTNVFGDIGTMPHLLIAGATGMGKSVCMNSLITSILYKARPDEVKFIMIDPKKVEFAPYNGIPHLLVPVVTDPKQAAGALLWAVDEMNKRYDIIEKLCVRNIDSYNEKVAENPELGAPMAKIVIFIDELNDLMIQVRDPVENLIMLIAQKARAAGIHLVIGTQRPSVNVITGVIKANIPSRIACKVSSGIDSRTILEQTGAEKLIGKGDMLFAPGGKPNPKRVQGAFVSETETANIVDFVKKQAKGELYDEQAMEDMKRAAQKCDKKSGEGDMDDDDDGESGVGYLHDRKFLNAVELAIRNGSVATSFLQRKLHIGYGKAAQYIDIMEDLGIVGEKNGSKARDVLVSMNEWNEKLSRLTCDD